jgi:hypothetical protein
MSPVKNERGVALVTALMLTLISLGIIMALLHIVMQSTKMSAMSKFYKNSVEASYGGVEGVGKDILPHVFANISSTSLAIMKTKYSNVSLDFLVSDACMKQKLTLPPGNWLACTAEQRSYGLSYVKSAPDLSFILKGLPGQPGYKVFSKIVDTTPGNTDAAAGKAAAEMGQTFLIAGATGVAYDPGSGSGSAVAVKHIPYLFKFEVQGERETNAKERSNLSVLYAF